jgi:acetoin utilization deacetylase AcuC-like enzyme
MFFMNAPNISDRNCHGCTMRTSATVCPACRTKYDITRFYKYIHLVDTNVVDSDTTYFTETTYIAIKNAVTLVCQMVDSKKNGFAVIRPPGHHASANKSEGFCIVNNIAIAAKYALTQGFKKIFIFDFDAHHGNGTQNIFYNKSEVFYCSIHTALAYPKTGNENEFGVGEGYGYNYNIIVPKGVKTAEYFRVFYERVIPVVSRYEPDLILVSAGFDGLSTDPMKIMDLDPSCYGLITKALVEVGVPVMMMLEGGYDLKNIDECIKICANELRLGSLRSN